MQRTMNIDGEKLLVRAQRSRARGNPNRHVVRVGKATFYFDTLDPQEAIDKAVAKYRAMHGKTGSDGHIDLSEAYAAQHAAWAGQHDCSGTGEGDWARAQYEKDKLGPGPRCWNCGEKITHQQAELNGTLCDECKAAQPEAGMADRIAKHPMYSPSDLKYLRKKGYSDAEILAFWDRDHGLGCKPCEHRFTYTGSPREVVQEVMRDNLSPQAVAAIAAHLHGLVNTKDEKVNGEVAWFTAQLLDMLGEQYNALCEGIGL